MAVSSKILVKNSTHAVIKFVTHHDYDGEVKPPYPAVVLPNQPPAEFEHHGSEGYPSQSIGAVVYRCTNGAGQEFDWMMSWLNIYGERPRKVYTEIMKKGHYANDAFWQEILKRLNNGNEHSEASWNNLSATVDVLHDGATNELAVFQGIIQAN